MAAASSAQRTSRKGMDMSPAVVRGNEHVLEQLMGLPTQVRVNVPWKQKDAIDGSRKEVKDAAIWPI